jgi:nucleoid DNA-binding protein
MFTTEKLVERLHLVGEQTPENVAADVQEAFRLMAEHLLEGTPVLTAGAYHTDLPTIHDVGNGRKVNTGMVRHMGWGLFRSDAVDARDPETGETYHIPEYSFSGGGAMNRNGPVSWTTMDGPDPERVYDFEAAKTAVAELQEAAEGLA